MLKRGQHLITEHEPGAGLCDDNPGSYWRCGVISWGAYRNSHSKPGRPLISRWVGVALDYRGITYSLGVVSGYPGHASPLLPYFSRSELVTIGGRRYRLFWIPRTRLNGSALHAASEDSRM